MGLRVIGLSYDKPCRWLNFDEELEQKKNGISTLPLDINLLKGIVFANNESHW